MHKQDTPVKAARLIPKSLYDELVEKITERLTIIPVFKISYSWEETAHNLGNISIDQYEIATPFDVTSLYINVSVKGASDEGAEKLYSGNVFSHQRIKKVLFSTLNQKQLMNFQGFSIINK